MSKQLLRSSATVGIMTLVSRLLGFIRDILIARMFGADATTDAFFVAFKIPNFLRRLFAEGSFAQAFVPVLSEYKQHGDKVALQTFIDRAGGSLALALTAMTIAGMLLAPLLILLFAPGFMSQGEQFDLAVQMLQITLPYLFFIGSTAFAGSILNTFGKFAIPALTPALLNICMIAAALWLAPSMAQPVIALAWGVFAAGALQLAFQFPALLRLDLLPRLRAGFHDPGVKRIMGLMLPAIFGVSITQINLLLDTLIASLLDTGSVSWLYYSDRLVEFPLGVCGMAIATVMLPTLAKEHAASDAHAFSHSLDWGLRLTILLGLPATLGLILLARPLTLTLYGYDAFSAHDAAMAARSLAAYACGLLGFMLIKVLAPGFAARHDMRTPVRYGMYALVVHLLLGIALAVPLAHAGLALATSLAAFFNAALLGVKLFKDRIYLPSKQWLNFSWRVLFACGAMVIALYYGAGGDDWECWDAKRRALQLALRIAAAMCVYMLALLLMGFKFRDVADRDSSWQAQN